MRLPSAELIRDFTTVDGHAQREFYKQPETYSAALERVPDSERFRLSVFQEVPQAGTSPRLVLQIEAEVGRLKRLVGKDEGEE